MPTSSPRRSATSRLEDKCPGPPCSPGQQAFNVNVTLSWDSSKIERISFYAITQGPAAFGIQFEPGIEKFARNAPCALAVIDRKFICAVVSADSDEYYILAVPYHRINGRPGSWIY